MSGYTPLFSSLTTGTLCGKWPDIGLWAVVLSMADRHGRVDVTHQYIATVSGLPLDTVVECMARFCGPDKHSRTPTADGARLTLLDDGRDWGWQIVNHAKYREKARLQARDSDRTASGANRERMQARKATPTHDDPLGPPLTPADPPSDKTRHRLDKTKNKDIGAARKRATPIPDDFGLTVDRLGMATKHGLTAKTASREFDQFADHHRAKGSTFRDWDAAWRTWIRNAVKFNPALAKGDGPRMGGEAY